MTTLSDTQASAARLIRAMREPEPGDDRAAWTARWVDLLQDASIEDAEAAIAAIAVERSELYARIRRANAGAPDPQANAGGLALLIEVRRSQQHFIENWVRIQDNLMLREERAIDAEARRIAIAKEEERRLAIIQAKKEREEIQLAVVEARAAGRKAALEVWAAAQAAQAKTAEAYRAYKLSIVTRERELARARVEAIRANVPDGSDEMVMVQAARHVIRTLFRLAKDDGVALVLPEHESNLANAIEDWLKADVFEQAINDTPLPEGAA